MKKFLSLLLALTLVLSLVVVPARATEVSGTFTVSANKESVSQYDDVTFTASATGEIKVDNHAAMVTGYQWMSGNEDISGATGSTYTVQAGTTGSLAVKCKFTLSYKDGDNDATATKVVEKSVSVSEFSSNDITVTIKGHTATIADNKATVSLVKGAIVSSNDIVVSAKSSIYACTKNYDPNTKTLDITVMRGSTSVKRFSLTVVTTPALTPTLTVNSPSASEIRAAQTVTLNATYAGGNSTGVTYRWTVSPAGGVFSASNATQTTWTAPASVVENTRYTFTCTATDDGVTVPAEDVESPHNTAVVTVKPDKYAISRNNTYSTTMTPGGSQTLSFSFTNSELTTASKECSLQDSEVSWSISGLPTTALVKTTTGTETSKYKSATLTVPVGTTATSCTVTATVTKDEKTYTVTYPITIQAKVATLPAVVNGQYTDYSNSYSYSYYYNTNLAVQAQTALGLSAGAVTSVSLTAGKTYNASICTGEIAQITGGYRFTAAAGFIGVAQFNGLATTSNGTVYAVTFKVPVTPYNISYEDQYPEPVATTINGTTYRYAVQVPSGYTSYYVVAKNASIAPTDWSTKIDSATHTSASPYYLYDTDFIGGKCTLYVVTYTSSTTYPYTANVAYCGTITVYQKNYNINYNGVAGETVQFKHADFTNFMNEVSQARGDASKTGSYPYVTFNYVTFNYPTSTQGTLYYNGTAMSNSSYSGSFNSRTQITNLDNVTFVPYARTSAKSIPLTFTLSVTKYGANGAVVNRDLKYTGTVAVSIVREDIKYTAAPGDTIRFTDSDFLNYLRTQNGFNSNYYSIDYVTFDQSAVNALNEGVLYAYSTGFNAVKTTDKFYYTTTSYNQNALSDVTFRASAYAKTGTTVYIPFTIYARYGTTGTGTRQVTGTVAIKLAQTMNFVDVKPTDYFYDSVKWAVNSNITKGTSATTFSPYKTCTRAEIVTFLWRAAGSKTPTITRNPFTDVAPSMGMDYYYAILWASQNGIAAGTSATTFSPNATCTRAQIVTFLWRYSNKPAGYYSNPFTDVNKAEHAAYYDAILWAVGKGITKGTTATTFSPYGTCTRGEAVTFLYRAVNGK